MGTCLCTYLSLYLSIYLSIHLSLCVCIYVPIYIFIYLFIHLSLYASICLSIYISMRSENSCVLLSINKENITSWIILLQKALHRAFHLLSINVCECNLVEPLWPWTCARKEGGMQNRTYSPDRLGSFKAREEMVMNWNRSIIHSHWEACLFLVLDLSVCCGRVCDDKIW